MKVKRTRKIFHVAGDKNLSECINANEDDNFKLDRIIWTGNLDAKAPGQVLTAKGEDVRKGLIHLYLVIFISEVPIERQGEVPSARGPKILN